jgi:hypothetical protein
MPKFYGAIDLAKNELQNAAIQNLGAAPSSPVKGQLYMNTADNTLYYWDGTIWQAMKSGTGGPPTGAAGGDLGGTYPNPTVVKSNGDFQVGAQLNVPNGAVVVGASPGVWIQSPSIQRMDISAVTLNFVVSGSIDFNNRKLLRIADPTVATDAASKNYVDNQVQIAQQGLDAKASVKAATTANIALVGGPVNIDGVAIVNGDRILVKNQTAPAENGIYYLNAANYVRATDADAWTELVSAYTWVEQGTVNADTGWNCTVDSGGTLGTTGVTWVQFNGAGAITAGAGLTKTANTLDVGAGTGILVAADTVAVDTAVVALKSDLAGGVKKFAAALAGNVAYATGEVVTHNLNTQDVHVAVYSSGTPFAAVQVDWEATTVNTVTLRYNPALGAGYRAVVIG